jgi:drug/metabolite transporter (DMT)-like permease
LPAFLLLAQVGRAKAAPLNAQQWRGLLVLGVFGYYLASLFDFIGLQYISSGLERLIMFTYPTLVLLFEALWHRHRISKTILMAMGVTYAGLLLAFSHDILYQSNNNEVWIGSAWVFLGSICFSIYFLSAGLLIKGIGSMRLAGYSGAIACVLVLSHFLIVRGYSALHYIPQVVWNYSAAMATISTVLPIWFAANAVRLLGASHTAGIGSLGPALTLVLGWLVLNEPYSWMQAAGMALVVAGVVWLGKQKAAISTTPEPVVLTRSKPHT